MTLSRKYKPGSRQNFSFQNRILYKKAQCCGELPWLAPTCENFPIVPLTPTGYICYGQRNGDFPPQPTDNDLTITLGNLGVGQATGNNYELYFGPTLIDSWVNAPATVSHTFTNYDFTTQNGRYTLVITNYLGCTGSFNFELLGVPTPVVFFSDIISPSGICVGCTDSPSELEVYVITPYPGFTYNYVIKGQLFDLCGYNSGLLAPSTYSFTNICADRYGVQVESYDPDGNGVCDYFITYDFNP